MESDLIELERAVISFKATSNHLIDGDLGDYFARNSKILIDWVFDLDNMKRSFMSSMILTSKNTEITKSLCRSEVISNLRDRWEQNKENISFMGKFWELTSCIVPYLESFEDCDFILYFANHTENYLVQFFFEKVFQNDPKSMAFYQWIASSEFSNIVYDQLINLSVENEHSSYGNANIYNAATLFNILISASKVPNLAELFTNYRFLNIYRRGYKNTILTNYLWQLLYELSLTNGNDMIDLIQIAIKNISPTEKFNQYQYYSLLFLSKMIILSSTVTDIILRDDVVQKVLNLYVSHSENTFMCQALHTFINSSNRKPKIMECILQTIIPHMEEVIQNEVNPIQVGVAYDIFQLLVQLQRTSIPIRNALKKDELLIDIVQNKVTKRNNEINQNYGGNVEKIDFQKLCTRTKYEEIEYPKEIYF